jgi:hypothetical protein
MSHGGRMALEKRDATMVLEKRDVTMALEERRKATG